MQLIKNENENARIRTIGKNDLIKANCLEFNNQEKKLTLSKCIFTEYENDNVFFKKTERSSNVYIQVGFKCLNPELPMFWNKFHLNLTKIEMASLFEQFNDNEINTTDKFDIEFALGGKKEPMYIRVIKNEG